jgi:hypothetical protein
MATAIEVRLIMKKTEAKLTDAQVAPFITAAQELVDTVLADTNLSITTLDLIGQWLAAHLIASTIFRMTSEEKLGDAQVKYAGKWGEGLSSTPYGQMVLMLDTSGLLVTNFGKRIASITAVGHNSFERY